MYYKSLLTSLVFGLGLFTAALQADDTDIYTNPGQAPGGEPLVMFSIDFRSNLLAQFGNCSLIFNGSTYCPEAQYFRDRGIVLADEGIDVTKKLYFFDVLRLALKIVLVDISGIKVGLMMPHSETTTGQCRGVGPEFGWGRAANRRCSNGGFILQGFELLSNTDSIAHDKFHRKLLALKRQKTAATCGPGTNSDSSCADHKYQGVELFYEFYRYLLGGLVHNGHNGWHDFEKNSDSSNMMRCWETNTTTREACFDRSTTVEVGTPGANDFRYVSPLTSAGDCTKLYTINLYFGNSQDGQDSSSEIEAPLAQDGMNISLPRSDTEKFRTIIDFLHKTDLADPDLGTPDLSGKQNVTSYFIFDGSNQNEVNELARVGGTGTAINLKADDPQIVIDALKSTLNEILSVSTTFVSANLPVNAFNRAEVLDNVYFALFQLDPDNKPNWRGNIKRLRKKEIVDPDNGQSTSQLVDVNDLSAIAADNRFKFDALTYWTDPNGEDVAPTDPETEPFILDEGEISGKDGRSVNRGGAGQQIAGFLSGNPGDDNNDTGARKMYTEPAAYPSNGSAPNNGTPTALRPFNADSSDTTTAADLQAKLGAADVDEALKIMRWLRGQDSNDENINGDVTEVRRWLVGDILHSRPQVINYGARGPYTLNNQDIRILTGTNHGVLHMFKNSTPSATPDGSEAWAFLPLETLGGAKTLLLNEVAATHPYGVDGTVSILKDDGNDGTISGTDKAWAYFGLRRGGKSYYSLDISDPDVPKMLWSVNSDPGTETEELGLTFSSVRIGHVQYGAAAVPAVFVAGGYDVNKDIRPGPGTQDSEGNALYILNAATGQLIWKAVYDAAPAAPTATRFESSQLKDSIPAEMGLIDANNNGVVDRAYVPDTGGRLWRVDLPESTSDLRNKWAVTLLADLGQYDGGGNPRDRRFFHGVDVAQLGGDLQTWHIVLGSGDRAYPKENVDENKLFVIKDRFAFDSSTGTLVDPTGILPIKLSENELGDITNNCLQEATCGGTPPDLTNGWFLSLGETAITDGEKVLSSPLIANDVIFFTTYLPNAGTNPGACLPKEGGGLAYAVRLDNGGAAFNNDESNDGSCNNDEGLCAQDRIFVTTDELPPGIPTDPVPVPPGQVLLGPKFKPIGSSSTERTFWYQIEDPGSPN